MNEETHRKLTTAKFKRDETGNASYEETKNSANVHRFLFNEAPTDRHQQPTERWGQQFIPRNQDTEEIIDEPENDGTGPQKSTISHDGFSNYLVGGGDGSQRS